MVISTNCLNGVFVGLTSVRNKYLKTAHFARGLLNDVCSLSIILTLLIVNKLFIRFLLASRYGLISLDKKYR